jgi:hypothetical protein
MLKTGLLAPDGGLNKRAPESITGMDERDEGGGMRDE